VSDPPLYQQHKLTQCTELHNRIYELAVEDDGTRPKFVSLRAPPTDGIAPTALDWANLKREFLGFNQTCRQLRAEFRPYLMKHIRVKVVYTNIYEYISTFVTCGKSIEDIEYPVCNVTVDMIPTDCTDEVDLAPLIRVVQGRPGLQLNFEDPSVHLREAVEYMMDLESHKIWGTYLEGSVSQVIIRLVPQTVPYLCMVVSVKPEAREGWMREWSGEDEYSDDGLSDEEYEDEEYESWWQRSGLNEICWILAVVVDESE
jgi:hypothetical protein